MKRTQMNWTLAALLALGLTLDTSAASRKSKKDEAQTLSPAEQIAAIPPMQFQAQPVDPNNPLANAFKDPAFVKSFLGGYGVKADIEPKFDQTKTNEVAFYRQLATVMQEDLAKAAYMISTNLTADSNPIFDYTLGTILLQNGETDKAVKHLEEAIAKFPTFVRAWKNLGMAQVRAGNFDEAIKPFTRVVELGGVDGQLYGLLGYCYMNGERFLPAEAAYRNAMIFMPDHKDWKMGLIKCLIGQGKFPEANRLVVEMLAKNPDDASLWALQASVFTQQDDYAGAAVNYEILRKFGKIDYRQLMVLGDIYMSRDATELALGVYLEGVDREEPGKSERSVRAATILASRGAFEEVAKLVEKIRKLHGDKIPPDDDLKLLKISSKLAFARGDTEQAVKALEQVIEKNPLDGEALLMVGDHYYKNQEYEKAEFRFDLAGRITGFEADALVKKAQIKVKQQKYAPAVEDLRKAQKLKPRDSVQRYLEAVERMMRQATGA
ncbi:MAG: tetratricopeptide repeat protein [Verrucomicrobiota bacterium]